MRGCRKGIVYDLDLGVAPNNEIGFGDLHQEAYWLGRLSRLAQNRPAENCIQIERPPKGRPLGGNSIFRRFTSKSIYFWY